MHRQQTIAGETDRGRVIYPAGKLARCLGISLRAVRKRLGPEPGSHTDGGPEKGWFWEELPKDWQANLASIAIRKGYRGAPELLAADADHPWCSPVPFSKLPQRLQDDAMAWRNALLPVLSQQHVIPPAELCQAGLLECRKVFGRTVSESTWRRHFDLAAKRDNGFEQWARLDIYLAEEGLGGVLERGLDEGGAKVASREIGGLTEVFGQVKNPGRLTIEERDFVWKAMIESPAPRKEVLDYAFRALPGLALTRKALGKAWRRKVNSPEDGRPGRSGRKGRALCPECEKLVTGAAVDLDGDIAQAWRRLVTSKRLCAKCAALWHFDVRSNKSYVPLAVRNQVGPNVLKALPWRHGPKRARLLAPYVLRRRDIGPGDVFEADDVTWNHIFYIWDTDLHGRPYVGRGECLLFLDRGAWYPVGYRLIAGGIGEDGRQIAAHYTGMDIRLGVLHVHDRVGLPHLGFQFENGIWKSRLVSGRQAKGWTFNPWRDFESGLNEQGIMLVGQERAVRHALPGNPRTKIIERMFRSVQERMRPLAGFVGFNHREYKPEVLDDFIRRVNTGKEHPGEMFLALPEFRDALDNELMAYADEVQNGRWLPGASPAEAWKNGIGGFPGVGSRPLRRLAPTARHLLSTHWRNVSVTAQGIRFEVGSRQLVFWGDELTQWQHRTIPVRWNIEEPELLHCIPKEGHMFTLKARELDSWKATPEEMADTSAARNRWKSHGKAVFDNLPHPLVTTVTRDAEQTQEVRQQGENILAATEAHRSEKTVEAREEARLAALAGALGMNARPEETLSQRALDAARRRAERAASMGSCQQLDQTNS